MSHGSSVREGVVPTLVEVWAPHCIECRRMEPDLDAVAAEFSNAVDLEKIDASVERDAAASLGAMATPTLIGYSGGAEVYRSVGRASSDELRQVFAALASGTKLVVSPRREDVMLRVIAGTVLTAVGILSGPSLPLVMVGTATFGWAVYPFLRRVRATRS